MSRATTMMLLLAALPQAGCFSFSSTWLTTHSGAPFQLGRMETALWLLDRGNNYKAGIGRATLLVVDDDFDCEGFKRNPNNLNGDVWEQDGFIASLRFSVSSAKGRGGYTYGYGRDGSEPGTYAASDDDWEGDYLSLDSVESIDEDGEWIFRRSLDLSVFADGHLYETEDLSGRLEIKVMGDDLVRGTIRHQWFHGRFSAEICGDGGGGYDTGYYGYGYGYDF